MGSSATSLERGRALFNAGRFFESHEAFEEAWREAEGDEKLFRQGLTQAAAAYHKRSQGGSTGYEYLLERARLHLSQAPEAKRAWVASFLPELGKDVPVMPTL